MYTSPASREENMKAFKVFWKDNISEEGQPYVGMATIIAENLEAGLAIGQSYGEVKTISTEDETVILNAKFSAPVQ